MNNDQRSDLYWRANSRLITILLSIWALVGLGGVLSVEWLNRFRIGGLPLGFWVSQQGAILVFVLLIFAYAILMDRLDHRYRLDVDEDEAAADPARDI